MAHLHRFYAETVTEEAAEILLSEEEAHHALKAVRMRDGDAAAVFDGQGREWIGTAARTGKRDVTVTVASVREAYPPPPLLLGCAWLHRDKAIEEIIIRGTELGVTRFVFFRAARSQEAPKPRDKWRKLAIEACKQCGRLWLPAFGTVAGLREALPSDGTTTLICTADRPAEALRAIRPEMPAAVFVGPEGDWTEAELEEALARGARPMSLGETVFRAEIAAITAAAVVQYERGLLGPK